MNNIGQRNNNIKIGLVGNLFSVGLCSVFLITMLMIMKFGLLESEESVLMTTVENKKTYEEPPQRILDFETIEKSQIQPVIPYGEEDIKLLANVMYYEVGDFCDEPEGEEILKLTGSVVINRVLSPIYPDTVYDVIYQPGQYAKCVKKQFGTKELPEKVYVWAEDLLKHGSIAPYNLVYQANFIQGKVYKEYRGVYFCLTKKF